jgi:hypothetical protein
MFQDSTSTQDSSQLKKIEEENMYLKKLEESIRLLNINETTPLKALEFISELKQLLKKTK